MRKKFFLLFIGLMTCFYVSAQSVTKDGITYRVISGTKNALISSGSGVSGDITIPDKVTIEGKEYTVTEIGNQEGGDGTAFGRSSITSVVIPSSVKKIKTIAFQNCKKLTTVTFQGNGLNEIEGAAFAGCVLLKVIDIPKSVTKIGRSAFYASSGDNPVPKKIILNWEKTDEIVDIKGDNPFITNVAGLADMADVDNWEFSIPGGMYDKYQEKGWIKYQVFSDPKPLENITQRPLQKDGFTYTFSNPISLDPNKEENKFFISNFNKPSTASVALTDPKNPPPSPLEIPSTVGVDGDNFKVTGIKKDGFAGTTIDKITIPDGIKEVGDDAFKGTKVKEVVVNWKDSNNIPDITRIGLGLTDPKPTLTIPVGPTKKAYRDKGWTDDKSTGHFSGLKTLSVYDIVKISDKEIKVYPDPVTKKITVFLPKKMSLEKLTLYNLQGQLVDNSTAGKLDAGQLSNGLYLLNIKTNQGAVTKKIIIRH